MLKQWAPSNCSVAPHFIAIGWCLVQVAILLKVWRTYYIFFNLRISTVIYGRLFTLKVTTKHLLATGAVLLVAVLGNVIIKFLMAPLTPEMRALSATQFTNACTMRITPLGIFGEWSWVMFQLHIAGGALWMSHKTKGVVSLYNEHGPVTYATLCQSAVMVALNMLTVLGEAVDPHVLVIVTTLLILLGSIGAVAVLATTTVVPISTWSAITEVLIALAQGNMHQVRKHLTRFNSRWVSGRSQQAASHSGAGRTPGAITLMLDQTGSMSADLDVGLASRGNFASATGTASAASVGSSTTGLGAIGSVPARRPTAVSRMTEAYDCAGYFSPDELRSMSAMAVPLTGILGILKPKEMLVARVTVHVSSNVNMRQLPRHRWSLLRPHWLPVQLVTFADVPLFLALPSVSKSVLLRGRDCRGIVHRGANTQFQMALADVSGDSTLCPLLNTGAAVLQLGPKTNPAIDQEPKPKGKDAGMTSWLIHMNDAASIVSWIAFLSSAFGIGGQQPARTKANSRVIAIGSSTLNPTSADRQS
ncbi:hypothetical protein BCR44DRAFT_280655 [Catenaria anguillulae PL171]|uniref:Uncharacterized protein n=1 Tax=Catenaria anguillulae PL171 TaxID=765915 RepID=A0A1Y2HQ09_9FUNG|nr:hypothetical protein BCR44DRAFT_280655 [Catenaria anguillulae PL171]